MSLIGLSRSRRISSATVETVRPVVGWDAWIGFAQVVTILPGRIWLSCTDGSDMEIWINPECSKCQAALTLLDAEGAHYTVRYYLQQPPTAQELVEVLARLGLQPWDVTRLGEPIAEELGLASWPRDEASRPRWIDALAAHPVLIQRPIITADDDTAAVARSPEAVHAAIAASDHSDRR